MKNDIAIDFCFCFQKYGKLWSVSRENYSKHKPLISDEWYTSDGSDFINFSSWNNQCIKRVLVCTQIWVGTFYWKFLTFSVFWVQCLQQFWGGKWRKTCFFSINTWKTDFHEGMWLLTNNLTMSMYVPIIMASYLFKILVIIPVQFHVKWTPN